MSKNIVLLFTALLFTFKLSAQIVPNYLPTNGLLGWWPFNGNANDESGNGNNCTVFNGVTLSNDRFNTPACSYFFDGIDDWIETNNVLFQSSEPHTISIWWKTTDSLKKNQTLFNTNPHTLENCAFHYSSQTLTPPFGISFGLGNGQVGTGSWNIMHPDDGQITTPHSNNTWHHLAWVKDSTLTWKFYIDGIMQHTFNASANTGTQLANLRFGAENAGFPTGGANFKGNLDDIGLWDRALSSLEIYNLYNGFTECTLPINLQNGLLAYWPFCGNANDESGNGNNGIVNGAILTADRFGITNSAFHFSQSQYIEIPNLYQNNIYEYTISAWIKRTPSFAGNDGAIVSGSAPGQVPSGLRLNIGTINRFQWHIEDTPGQNGIVQNFPGDVNNYCDNTWHFVVGTFSSGSGLVSSSAFKLYVDGHLVQTISNYVNWPGMDTTTYAPINNGTRNTIIGNCSGSYFNFSNSFLGILDDIGIWNRALSDIEILQLYGGTPPTPCAQLSSSLQSGLIGYWPFCGNANDESGNGNNGIVNGAILTTDRFGNTNNAFSYNGTNDFISIGDPASGIMDFSGGTFSISGWVKSLEPDAPIITKQNPSVPNNSGDYNMDIAQGNARMAMGFGSGAGAARHSNAFINDNIWHHIVSIYTSTSIDVYVDGVLSNGLNTHIGSHPTLLSNSSQPLLFGKGFNNSFLQGKLDDIGIWNRALTESEIEELYSGNPPCNLTSSFLLSDTIQVCDHSYSLDAGNSNSTYYWNTGATSQIITAYNSGWYTCTITQGNCTATDSLYLSLVNAQVIQNDTTICEGQSLLLKVNYENDYFNNELTKVVEYGSSTYYISNLTLSWQEANIKAKNALCHLATLTSYQEDTTVSNVIARMFSNVVFPLSNNQSRGECTIGLFQNLNNSTFSEPSGGWEWVTGEPFIYSGWYPGEPNNNSPGSEFGSTNWLNTARWNDSPSDNIYQYQYLLERPTPSISIIWSTGSNQESIIVSPSQTTTYYCTVSNGISSCIDSVTITVRPVLNSQTIIEACENYFWNGQIYTENGTYTYNTINNAGCDSTSTLILIISNPQLSFTSTDVNIFGGNNGSATANLSGGIAPFGYLWSNNSTNASISGLNAGNYTVTVTDAAGCSVAGSITISQPPASDCGPFRTFAKGGWGTNSNGFNPGQYLANNFINAYPIGLQIGACNRYIRLSNASSIVAFLPTSGTPARLPAGTSINPIAAQYKNTLAGHLIALNLNITFDSINTSFALSQILFKNAIVASGPFAGLTVQQLYDLANDAIGCSNNKNYLSSLNTALDSVNQSWLGGIQRNRYVLCPTSVHSRLIQDFTIPSVDIGLLIYPNPTLGEVIIEFATEELSAIQVQIYSALGMKVLDYKLPELINGNYKEKIDLSSLNLSDGLYLMNVKINENIHSTRIIYRR